jgi:hypothetical protein
MSESGLDFLPLAGLSAMVHAWGVISSQVQRFSRYETMVMLPVARAAWHGMQQHTGRQRHTDGRRHRSPHYWALHCTRPSTSTWVLSQSQAAGALVVERFHVRPVMN